MNIIVTDHGDPSTGIYPASYTVETPFRAHEIGEESLDYFKAYIVDTFQEFAFGRITAMYDFEIEEEDERWRSLNSIAEQGPE